MLRGTASVSAFLLAFTSFGSVCAESYASQVNSFLGVKTSKMVSNSDSTDTTAAYPSSYGDFTEENLKNWRQMYTITFKGRKRKEQYYCPMTERYR